jgi:CheY-like chemotaxis protein
VAQKTRPLPKAFDANTSQQQDDAMSRCSAAERGAVVDNAMLPSLSGRKILIVEDDVVVAEEMRYTVTGAGGMPLGPVPSVEMALYLIAQQRPDAALLDIHLSGASVEPIAHQLHAMYVPYVVVSGFSRKAIPRTLRDAPFVAKPFYRSELLQPLTMVFQTSRQ